MAEEIPQIIAIVSISPDGKVNLKKDVREHLGMKDAQTLFLDTQDEIILSAEEGTGEEIPLRKGNRILLPEGALRKLGITDRSLVGLVQRRKAVAVKKVEIEEKEGEKAKVVDLETTYKITRMAETNSMPEKLLPRLRERYKDFKLRYDVKTFLGGRQTFEAWRARETLGIAEPSDEELRRELIRDRLEEQGEDGSWGGKVTITARNLRELAELGMTRDDREIRRAVDWLMKRPQSSYNPGMFFVTDELVEEQEEVIKRREKQTKGTRERFRKRRASEIKLVRAGDDLIGAACGPRIMWPNALVLEALLKLGYEDNERVQAALRTLMQSRWCECAYQHGLSGFKRKEPYSMEEVEEIERACIEEYRYGGMSGLKELGEKDLAHKVGTKMPRIAHNSTAGVDEYPLKMPDALPGCDFITARALSQVRNEKMRRLAEAHLWRFAGRQHSTDGEFVLDRSPTVQGILRSPQAAYLKLFASYDHPVSKVVIMRSIPWIVENQNKDGSWGDESTKDVSTLAVISALKSIGLI
ncbi:MAG: hypothetical protein ACETVR_03330 [Candidatus Bathyarchaeia archaeon]